MSEGLPVDAVALRDEVRAKYRNVAVNLPGACVLRSEAGIVSKGRFDWTTEPQDSPE